jgi:hypothetical protein
VRVRPKVSGIDRRSVDLDEYCVGDAVARSMKRRTLFKPTLDDTDALLISWFN